MRQLAVALRQTETAVAAPEAPTGLPVPLQRLLPSLTAALRSTAPPLSSRIGTMSSYHLGWTDADGNGPGAGAGKFLRGCLALWAAERCSGRTTDALCVAAAIEWIHNFTLVHDDIQDGDYERRHQPAVWVVWGSAQAINAGDGMHAVAYRALLSGRDRPQARLRAAAALNEAILAVIEGQCLDLELEGQVDTTISTYLRLARAKTGALIGAALEAGALISGSDRRQATLMRRAGVELGVAFQIRDDWLGIWGDTGLTGKGCTGDVGRRKLTYPVVLGQSLLHGAARREFRRLYATRAGDEERILALLNEAGAGGEVAAEVRRHCTAAIRLVQGSGLEATAVEDFGCIVDFVAERVA
ncbi:MAG: polyprenyl synthetase family protein [Candidatus Dormibacteraeota bacterium]|uniref:Polyprenyl synthetase family protein n=1 Tax=Candidatus Amunia macphersoniae TaxID=3127014 RepID=A0A934N941_9BACT|nr:polyprenyl synthetase family protein [Candidatus Dormibacteraeota bacterium]